MHPYAALASKETVIKAMELTAFDIADAFERNGHIGIECLTATFRGMRSQGSFEYECTCTPHDGEVETFNAYVRINHFGLYAATF